MDNTPLPSLQPITIENAADVRLLKTLRIPDFEISSRSQCSIAFSSDGNLLSAACYQNTLPVWDVQSGRLLSTLEPPPTHHVAVAFSPDGRQIAAGGTDKSIQLWDIANGQLLRTIGPLPSPIWELAYGPNGDALATASFKSQSSDLVPGIHLWNAANDELLWDYAGDDARLRVLSVDYAPDGKTIACGTFDSALILDAATGQLIQSLPIPNHVGDLAFSADGLLLATGSDDHKIRLWSTDDYSLLATLDGHSHYVNGVAFSPDGQWLASGSHDEKVGIWDTETGQPLALLAGHEAAVLRVAVNPSGTLVASVSWDGTVRLWGIEDTPISIVATPTAQPSSTWVADFASYLSELASNDQFSGAVLVARNDETLLKVAYGLADRSRELPNQVDTKFNLGSMNKMFTAVAIVLDYLKENPFK
jgi:WD40 repeat protein